MKSFTEADTELFYDKEDSLYRSFWDENGSLHWGYYDQLDHLDSSSFVEACQRWNKLMLEKSTIDSSSYVLDIGCGNGNTAIWLSENTGCKVVGVDLSEVRIANAVELAARHPRARVEFYKASATDLPFSNGCFTHVWSQATFYHVHALKSALQEVNRVLVEGGSFIFDDLTTPRLDISEKTKKHVYERLLFSPTFTADEYARCLNTLGLLVVEDIDLNEHLYKSYVALSQLAADKYPELTDAYHHMQAAINSSELGWHFYHCTKVSDRLAWIYREDSSTSLQEKYAIWSRSYDADLFETYRASPLASAQCLAQHLCDQKAAIADIGAGTGMVGEALAELGYCNISAIDFSAPMLKVAANKGVYHSIDLADIQAPLPLSAAYDAMIAVGVFTFSHAKPTALLNLDPLLKPGGYFVLTVREDYYCNDSSLQNTLDKLNWQLVSNKSIHIFADESMNILVFKKWLTNDLLKGER
ncbi:methyltransferase domain-containing protein [Thalassomonas viridans]|uniref:Methyltransferase domain-containing protein n=1 Tax=Thalassomonas viridans TaxID=137584 RepID=A0AAE9Z465_9GAMM|nr:methyltransferase domain-containing protein [Thalassomonas viridans]WDE05977.1 methyltransferase domain-containing protein [Thalassomonas viridans]